MMPPLTRVHNIGWKIGGIAALWFVLSCASAAPGLGRRGCPVIPVSSMDLPASTRLRARVQIRVGNRALGLEVIARKGPAELVVAGLAPQGTRLFGVRQRDRDIAIETTSSRKMEQLALWVMDALHRGLWIEPAAGSRLEEGASWTWEGEHVVEIRRDGRWWREFRSAKDATNVAPVAIEYRDESHPGGELGFEIRNAWCGYEAVIIPLDEADQGRRQPATSERIEVVPEDMP